MLPFIPLLDVGDARYLAVGGNADIATPYSTGTVVMFLSPCILDVSSVPFWPHASPVDLPQVTFSGNKAGLSRRLRSSARSGRGGYDSVHTSRSGSHDSVQIDFAREEEADSGTSGGSPKHSSTSPEPRTSQMKEDSQQWTGTDAVLPSLNSAARQH